AADPGEVTPPPAVIGHRHAGIDMTGHGTIDRNLMIVAAVRHRTDQRHLVRLAGEQGKLIANFDAGDGGGNGSKGAADGTDGLGLEVPKILMRRPSPQEDEDTRPGTHPSRMRAGRRLTLPGQ